MAPEGWTSVRLSEVADQRTKKSFPIKTDTRPYIALENLAQGRPTLLGWSEARTAFSAKTVFRRGDVLFGKLRPYLRKAAPAPFDGLCSTDILPLFGRGALNTSYLGQLAQSNPLQRHAVATSSGTKMPRTSWRLLGTFRFSLPPPSEQRKIVSILSSTDEAIEKTQKIIDQVHVVKHGLIQELLARGLPGRHARFETTEIGEIPEAWRVLPLKKLVASGPDNGLYRPKEDYGKGTPIVRIDTFDNGTVLRCTKLKRVLIPSVDIDRFRVRPGDILINRVNSLSHLAKCAFVASCDEPTVYESNMMRLTLDDSQVLREFGFLWLSSDKAKKHLRSRAKRAVAQASVNQTDVLTIPTPRPPRAEQQRIVEISRTLEGRLEAEERALTELSDLKSALMSVLLTGELRVTPDPEPV